MRIQADMKEGQMKIRSEQMLEQQRLQSEMMLAKMTAAMDSALEKWKAELDARTKIAVATIQTENRPKGNRRRVIGRKGRHLFGRRRIRWVH